MMNGPALLMDAQRLMFRRRYAEAFALVSRLYAHAQEPADSPGRSALDRALYLWGELAGHHAPAHAALARVRDDLAAILRTGPPDRTLLRRVATLDASLGEAAHTRTLFLELTEHDTALAAMYAHAVLPALIAVGDFALAERLLSDPEQVVHDESAFLNREFASRRMRAYTRAPRIAASIHNYAAEIRKVLRVLEGRGRIDDARRLHTMAIDAIPATTLRRAVRTALQPGAQPWYARGRPELHKKRTKERLRHRRLLAKGARGLAPAVV
ncbi:MULTISPECIES: hypothetical protein [unclassified Massilia]|uniref:hypothetical protein n=1 Tax=unclassified Massilia TaxID=2609279 RepID=UPI0017861FDD|nr:MULTISPECIES: hypothetical protein [unclassified Massilia]MBD8529047.1 hypothetical protein [Massilia sp. CFBP 13647]MBD8672441.1 hypothetical protein [Massilia sp. CFBP 13721]